MELMMKKVLLMLCFAILSSDCCHAFPFLPWDDGEGGMRAEHLDSATETTQAAMRIPFEAPVLINQRHQALTIGSFSGAGIGMLLGFFASPFLSRRMAFRTLATHCIIWNGYLSGFVGGGIAGYSGMGVYQRWTRQR